MGGASKNEKPQVPRDRRAWSKTDWDNYYALTADGHHRVVTELQGVQSEAFQNAQRYYLSTRGG